MTLKEVSIETATTCNQRCTFCPVAVTRRAKENLSLERLEKILSGINPEQIQDIHIVGFYEPTYDKQLVEKITVIRKAGFNFSIFTNASGLKPNLTDKLLNLEVSRITINLSTLDEAEYQQTRGTKDLKRILPNLDYLFSQVRTQTKKPIITIIILGALDQQHGTNIQMITKKYSEYSDVLGFQISPFGDYAGDVKTKLVPRKQFNHQNLVGCAREYQNERLYFNAQGEAVLCCQDYFGQYKLGNIDESSVTEIHQGKNITEWRQWISGEEDAPEDFICRSCLFAISDDHFAERIENLFCKSCVLPSILGVENSCHRCEVNSTSNSL
jgi:radical SAM protein with 4Fe4S-binding SPASM domain